MHTTKSNFWNFVIEYFGEIKKEFENTLACLSGAQMGSNHAKKRGRKSRDTLHLRKNYMSMQFSNFAIEYLRENENVPKNRFCPFI